MSMVGMSVVGMAAVGQWITNVRGKVRRDAPKKSLPKSPLLQLPAPLAGIGHLVRKDGLTYLSERKLTSLLKLALEMEQRCEPGTYAEAGCALGGSAIALTAAKTMDRPFLVYDVFGMIPPPSSQDGNDVHERYEIISSGKSVGINGNPYYGYETDLQKKVTNSFARLGYATQPNHVSLVKGLLQDTLTDDRPVCLAHIDVDWYDPVMVCLERIVPRLTTHGAIVLDDYLEWSGCHRATNDYFDRAGRENFRFDESAGHLVVRRAV